MHKLDTYSQRLLLTSSLLLLLSTLLLISAVTAQGLIYRGGDWLKYRITIDYRYGDQTQRCEIICTVRIENVNSTRVTSSADASVEKGGGLCSYFASGFTYGSTTVDVGGVKPESGRVLVDPSYTGSYSIEEGVDVEYYKGVLRKASVRQSFLGIEVSMSMELIDTSISELKSPATLTWLIPVAVIATLAAVVSVVVLILRRKTRAIETEVPIQTPPPPSSQPIQ